MSRFIYLSTLSKILKKSKSVYVNGHLVVDIKFSADWLISLNYGSSILHILNSDNFFHHNNLLITSSDEGLTNVIQYELYSYVSKRIYE